MTSWIDALTLLGPTIAALLAAFAYLYRVNSERRQRLSSALFALLELYRVLFGILLRPSISAANIYIAATRRRFPQLRDEDLPQVEETIRTFLESAEKQMMNELNQGLMDRFEEAVTNIAPFAPMLASRIRANRAYTVLPPLVESHFSSLHGIALEKSPSLEPIITQMEQGVRNRFVEELLTDLRSDIRRSSFRISFLSGLSCVWRQRVPVQNAFDQELRKNIESVGNPPTFSCREKWS